ncbi:MAG: hypothetical protein O2782_13260 [bacterium]|nr:hypothetical protein [bacterium]
MSLPTDAVLTLHLAPRWRAAPFGGGALFRIGASRYNWQATTVNRQQDITDVGV